MGSFNSLKISTPSLEGELKISKCLKHQVLLSAEEMEKLLNELGDFSIFAVSEPVSHEEAEYSKEGFLSLYREYIDGLKTGLPPIDRLFRRAFSSVWTVDPSLLYAMEVGGNRLLIKPLRPVIQLQLHRFILSEVDEKVHPLVLGPGSISWGIQLTYPQLYQDPKSEEIAKVTRDFPNSDLYWRLSRWLRNQTLPTPFLFKEKQVASSLRLGRECLPWINQHPELVKGNIQCALSLSL